MGNRYFSWGKLYWFFHRLFLLLKYIIKRLKIHKAILVLEEKKQNLLYLKCTPQNVKVWEKRKKMQRQKTGWTLLKQNGQQEEVPVHSIIAQFSSPCLSPVKSENKKKSALSVVGFQACSTWLTTVHPLSFLLCFLYPSFQGFSCSQSCRRNALSTQTTTLQGPHWTVFWQNWRKQPRGVSTAAPSPQPRMKERQVGQQLPQLLPRQCTEKSLGPLQTSRSLLWCFMERRESYRQHGFSFPSQSKD